MSNPWEHTKDSSNSIWKKASAHLGEAEEQGHVARDAFLLEDLASADALPSARDLDQDAGLVDAWQFSFSHSDGVPTKDAKHEAFRQSETRSGKTKQTTVRLRFEMAEMDQQRCEI